MIEILLLNRKPGTELIFVLSTMETKKSNMSNMFREISKTLEPKHDEDNNPPRIASIKPQFNPSTTMGTQSTRTPASHAMKQSYITLASVPFKTFDATRADTTLILSRFIPTSGIFRPPSEKVFEVLA
ncbi:hypothetical protein Lalb_Chr01g0002681 [Lupinus albus]|uniref:Uncharacterized protein n=1 Tax=Lupinus albus TaxID=3870 RepID=A0A6A4R0Z5_LUPAL|nr:hypothetical protein Lalb_Chr01g0002681 [Lupinus albus]